MKPTQNLGGFIYPLYKDSLFSGVDELSIPYISSSWNCHHGRDLQGWVWLRENGDLEKKFQKIFHLPNCWVIFCVHWNPSNGQSPNKKTQIQDSEEKSKFLKNIFLFYRNCQTRANLVHPKMWDRLKQNSLGSTALGICLEPAPTSQNPLAELDFIRYLLKSSPKNEQTQKWQTTSSFQQFSTNVFSLLVTPNKNKSFPNFVPLRFAWSW